MTTAFLSYSHEDTALARALTRALREGEIETFSALDLAPGTNVSQAIEDGIASSDAFIVLLSRALLKSEWGRLEIAAALASASEGRAKLIVPVLVDKDMTDPSSEVPALLTRYQWLDLRDGVDAAKLRPLLRHLRSSEPLPSLSDQLDAEEALLRIKSQELARARLAYEMAQIGAERRRLRAFTSIGLLIAVLSVGVAAIPLLTTFDGDRFAAIGFLLAGIVSGVAAYSLFDTIRDRRKGPGSEGSDV